MFIEIIKVVSRTSSRIILLTAVVLMPSLTYAEDLNDKESPSLSDTAVPDLFTGTMNYQIPIEVPPGINGLQPTLTLFYRSSSGNGWLGQGWEMEVGAIERSTRTGIADYTADDYVFRRLGSTSSLISIGNGEFRSKMESDFMSIKKQSNGSFIATNKLGIKYFFGQTINAQVYGPPGVFKWLLNRMEDPNGNAITFIYRVGTPLYDANGVLTRDSSDQLYLDTIYYNGNTITFTLEDRIDAPISDSAFFSITTGKRLKQIDVRSRGGSLARSYVLNYQPGAAAISTLTSVQKYGKDGATGDLSQVQTFTYKYFYQVGDLIETINNGSGGTATISYYKTPASYFIGAPPPYPIMTVDTKYLDDGNGNKSFTGYNISGGYYHAGENDFRGFNYANTLTRTETGATTAVKEVETWFHQGNDVDIIPENATTTELITRANVTTGYMKGKPYRVRVSNASGITYSETETTYAAPRTGDAFFFAPPAQVDIYNCDGLDAWQSCKDKSGSKHFQKYFVYDFDSTLPEYGNLSLEYYRGDVDDPDDDYTIYRTYSPNASAWIVGLPASQTVYSGIGFVGAKLASTSYYYDVATDCNANNISWSQTPAQGKLTRVVHWLKDKDGNETYPDVRMAYDNNGNLKCRRDARLNTTTIAYDSESKTFPVSVTSPPTANAPTGLTTRIDYYGVNGISAGNGYDGLYGQVKSVSDPNDAAAIIGYDGLGRKNRLTKPDQFETVWKYLDFGMVGQQRIRTETSDGLWSYSHLDGFLRPTDRIRVAPSGSSSSYSLVQIGYDPQGSMHSKTLPTYQSDLADAVPYVSYYDLLGRVTQTITPDSKFQYSCYGPNVKVTIDENGHRRRKVWDAYGRLIKVQEYTGSFNSCDIYEGIPYAATLYAYDVLGNLLSVTDAKGNQTTMRYDTLGRKYYMKDPDMGEWWYGYDANGNLTTRTDAKGKTITFIYDALNRLTTKHYPSGPDVVLTYDESRSSYYNKGRLTTMTDGSGQTVYNYDPAGRVTSTTKTIVGMTDPKTLLFSYTNGRLNSITYPDNEILGYTYDTAGNLKNAGDYVTYTLYDALGRPRNAAYGTGGASSLYTYDPVTKRLATLSVVSPDSTQGDNGLVINNSYGYDNKGNINSITDNLNKSLPTNFSSETYTPVRAHAVGATGTGRVFQYDENGNMTSDGVRSITYNYDNIPTAIGNVGFAYDGNGTRVKKTSLGIDNFYIDKLYECNSGGCLKYIFAGDRRVAIKSGTVVLYYHPDHQGSTSVVTDAIGRVHENIAYHPFGETRSDDGTVINLKLKHKYTGQEMDKETGLYNYNARIYDPGLGRFLTPDSIVSDPSNPQSLNRYAYVMNNPMNYTDPTGHTCVSGYDVDIDSFCTGDDSTTATTINDPLGAGSASWLDNYVSWAPDWFSSSLSQWGSNDIQSYEFELDGISVSANQITEGGEDTALSQNSWVPSGGVTQTEVGLGASATGFGLSLAGANPRSLVTGIATWSGAFVFAFAPSQRVSDYGGLAVSVADTSLALASAGAVVLKTARSAIVTGGITPYSLMISSFGLGYTFGTIFNHSVVYQGMTGEQLVYNLLFKD